MAMTLDEIEEALMQQQAEAQVLSELATALFLTHPDPQRVLAMFKIRIDSMVRSAPKDFHPEQIVELRARGEQHRLVLEMFLKPPNGGD